MLKRIGLTRGDALAILALLIVAAIGYAMTIATARHASDSGRLYAVVRVDGEFYAALPLNEDSALDVNGHNVLRVSGGAVFMESADCPDKLCVRRGRVSSDGQRIVCLPNRVSISVETQTRLPGVSERAFDGASAK
ncbi:MAG: NusG domain II-containing protein [Oscillospiraceae bacterium]|jgi:hypothetical protein|nr:NusG domain II-containing protein [Oscillospiraceae bacterium]